MSTKQTTQTNQNQQWANQYDPASMKTYQQFLGSFAPYMTGQVNNPFGNPFYQFGLQQSMKGASQAGANNMGALAQLMRTSGFGGSAGQGFQAAQMGRIGRANSGMMANAKIQNVLGALTRQQGMAQSMMGYQPLVTGGNAQMQGTQTTSTGGLGSWLPQVAGMGMSALMGGLGMGAPSMLSKVSAPSLGFGGMGGMMGGASMNPLSSYGASSWDVVPPTVDTSGLALMGGFGRF